MGINQLNKIGEGSSPVFQFTPRDIEGAIEDNDPLWILVFPNGQCIAGSRTYPNGGRARRYMDLTHLLATCKIDLDNYMASSPEPIGLIDED